MRQKKNKSGFIALITSIILSLILLTVAIALNQTSYITRTIILESEYKERSGALAEACADAALLKIAENPLYSGNESGVAVGSDTCNIGAVAADSPASGQTTINTNAVFPASSVTTEGAVTNIRAIVNSSDFSVVSWEELP